MNEALGHLYHEHHPKHVPIRRLSNDRVIRELEWVRREFPFVGKILFTDDDFTARPLEELRDLCDKYRTAIGLPFDCYVSAPTVSGEKIDALIHAGMRTVSLGVQSGSDRTNFEVYNRRISRRRNNTAIATISKRLRLLDPKIPFKVHYIVKNPWESRKDVARTARMICGLPRRAYVILFSLNYFPGTRIFDRALTEGVVENVDDDVEDYDGWTGKHLTLDRKTGRPSPPALLPLLAVQHIRFLPIGLRGIVLLLLSNPIGFRLLGTWRFSGKIRRIVEFLSRSYAAFRALFRRRGDSAYSERHLS
ncbi:radical SAM protein [Candidatus Sumerlaeota bacterium]|nr:radical SAM protein [Candidatus Sumerlaeota bacterium]